MADSLSSQSQEAMSEVVHAHTTDLYVTQISVL